MKNNLIKILCFAFVMLITAKIQAQYSTVDSLNTTYLNWYNLDSKIDKIQGASVDRAYNELLKNKTPKKKIIVAVIDGGVDTAHADLKGKIWLNKDEIPNNGIDDDNNGYIDDMHGWNFIGNTNGKNILNDNYEYIRILKKGNELYKNVKSINDVSALQQNDYKTYLLCK
ncbi:MAG: peptidase S8, partial [Bacteroidetes bacterium]|nr:peptidase S8 [Bacteroidota bacterium]